jgi:hypothetical protein
VNGQEDPGLFVVEGEAQLRYARACGQRAWTRDALLEQLLAALAPTVKVASPLLVRLALSDTLAEMSRTEPWLAGASARGGRAWAEVVTVALASLAEAHAMGWLDASRPKAVRDSRARVVLAAGQLLDARLGRAGLVAPAAREEVVAHAIVVTPPESLALALGTGTIVATGMASWRPA